MQPTYRTATVLVNSAARGVNRRVPEPERLVRYLRHRGLEARLVMPASAAEATAAARDSAARGDHLLFVAGGDGSVRDAALGLAGSNTALAALPAGTVNIWARETGLPRSVRAAMDIHLSGRTVRVDLGRADGQCFLLMASAGWDAKVAASVSPMLKRRVGDIAYMVRAMRIAPRLRPTEVEWVADGEAHVSRLALIVVSNTRLYGGRVRFAPDALADDGLLNAVAVCPHSLWDMARMASKLIRGRLASDRAAVGAALREVRIETAGIPFQLDGDYAGETPITFSVDPGALVVSIPAGPLPRVISGQGAVVAPFHGDGTGRPG